LKNSFAIMAAFVGKFIGKKILGESLQNKFGKEDPYFESVPATRIDGKLGKPGKVKRRKKALPPGISEHDGQVLTKVKRRAYRLDCCLFTFLGVKFGWGSAIGLVPFIGDALDAFMAIMVMKTCMQIEGGLPSGLRAKMMFNIIIDFVIGLVPFAGDLVDALFRANTRNAVLLEEHLRQKGKKQLRQSGLPMPAVDPSDPDAYDVEESATPGRRSHPPSRQNSARSVSRTREQVPTQPPPAQTRQSRSGWFGRGRDPAPDIEQAQPSRSTARRDDRRSNRH